MSSLFNDGELAGKLKLRKFNEVRVVIELERINGIMVNEVIIVFGNIWCRIMCILLIFIVCVVCI